MKKYASPKMEFVALAIGEDILITSVGQGEDEMYDIYDFGNLEFEDKITF